MQLPLLLPSLSPSYHRWSLRYFFTSSLDLVTTTDHSPLELLDRQCRIRRTSSSSSASGIGGGVVKRTSALMENAIDLKRFSFPGSRRSRRRPQRGGVQCG